MIGCGHTGTTLISGILHVNGYGGFDVSRLFENRRLNKLNERILDGSPVDDREIREFLGDVERRAKGRWSLKDPRLSETAGRFYPHIREPVGIIFNYRHPGPTVRALYREREVFMRHEKPAEMLRAAEDEWLRRNLASLEFLDKTNRSPVLIVRYDDLVDGAMDASLCRFTGRTLDTSFIDPRLRHSQSMDVRQELDDVYEELNRRFDANQRELAESPAVRVNARRGRTVRTRLHMGWNRLANTVAERRERRRRQPPAA